MIVYLTLNASVLDLDWNSLEEDVACTSCSCIRAATKMSLLPRVSFSEFLLRLPVGSVNKESYLGKLSWLPIQRVVIQATPVVEYHILQFLEIDFAIIQEFKEYSRTLGFQQQSETKCNIVLTSTANAIQSCIVLGI